MFARDKRIGPYTYVYLVENVREEGRTKQRIIANLGRKPRGDRFAADSPVEDARFEPSDRAIRRSGLAQLVFVFVW